ncbi:MAG: outer membrane beta-barrel domain-containing protein [Deltaproteobacteria bacterium]|nr:MAG: outer membrane beta-barrel domain-containing protein [Deltaproteobacteria bacterium]
MKDGQGARIGATVAVLAAAIGLAPVAHAQNESTRLATVAVQNRRHLETHEFGVAIGLLPLDAFTKGLTISLAYTYHFNETFAWEMLQGTYSIPIRTPLNDDLEALDIRPTPFEVVQAYATSNFIFKPIYWKGAWLNGKLIYGEIFTTVGGGAGILTRSIRPAVDVGLGFRFYASENVSFRLDVRDLAFLTTSDIQNEIWIGLGLSI